MDKEVRIQKYLSEKGILSRRKTETYIQNGWILVNGETVTQLGTKIRPGIDTVTLSKEAEQCRSEYRYIMFNKPPKMDTHSPQHGHSCIQDSLPPELKSLAPIGRLDYDSEGLILLSDDGIFAKHFLSPKNGHEREYEVSVTPALTPTQIKKIEQGVSLFNQPTKPIKIIQKTAQKFQFILVEGKNRQIRRIVQKVGATVTHLRRVRISEIEIGSLAKGEYRVLSKPEINSILS